MKQAITLTGFATIFSLAASPGAADEMFITHELDMERSEAVAAVRDHVEAEEDWLFLAEFGLAGGAVTVVLRCFSKAALMPILAATPP